MAELSPPWLNEASLAKILQGGEDKDPRVTVSTFSVQMAVAPGNNYSSQLLRAKVTYHEGKSEMKTMSLIIKIPFSLPFMVEMMKEIDMFIKEPRVYSELLPRMTKKLNFEFGPRTFDCPVKGLILQDLTEDGYAMSDRQNQLDYECSKVALKSLARFHAVSVACYHDDPDFIKDIGQELFYVQGTTAFEQFKPLFTGCMANVAKAISEITGFEEEAKLLTSKAPIITDLMVETAKPRESGLNVLNHGDFWINNLLFKRDDSENVVGVKFIDFQICRYASPALDLIYFIWSSSNRDVCENSIDDLLKEYLDTLNSSLKELGCPERMTVDELRGELKRCVDLGLITICNMLPLVLVDSDKAVNMAEFSMEDMQNVTMELMFQEMMKTYTGERFMSVLPVALKQFFRWYNSL